MTRRTAADPVLQWAREQGCETTPTARGHYRVTYQGRFVGTVASTPSDQRSMLNAKSFIRRNVNKIRQEQP